MNITFMEVENEEIVFHDDLINNEIQQFYKSKF